MTASNLVKGFQNGVSFNVNLLKRHMENKDMGTPDLSKRAGVDERHLRRIIKSGRCTYYTLDKIACGVGMHPLELML